MNQADILLLAGLRVDGRKSDDIRSIRMKCNPLSHVDGSCYMEQGLNKVLVTVSGPMEPIRRVDAQSEDGVISCRFLDLPFSGIGRKRRKNIDRRIIEMENIIEETFASVVMLELYPKSEIQIVVHLLENDGSSICTIINAVSMALMCAGISMRDIVTSCSVGIVKGGVCLDISQLELSAGGAFMPMAVIARSEEVVYMQLDSKLSTENLQICLESSIKGCKRISKLMETEMKDHMRQTSSTLLS